MFALPKFGLEKSVVGSFSDYMLHIVRVGGGSSAAPTSVATSTSRNIIKVYDAQTMSLSLDYNAHTSTIHDLVALTAGPTVLMGSCAGDSKAKLWDLREKDAVMVLQDILAKKKETLSISLAKGGAGEVLVAIGLEDGRNLLWDLRNTLKPRVVHQNHSNEVRCVRFWSPQGSHHLSSAYDDWQATSLLTGSDEGIVCVVDFTQVDEDDALLMVLGHNHAVLRIEASGGPNVAVQSQTQRFSVWNAETGECLVDYGDMRMGSEFYPQHHTLQPAVLSVVPNSLNHPTPSVLQADSTFLPSNHPEGDLAPDQQNESISSASSQFVYQSPLSIIDSDVLPQDHFNLDFLVDSVFDNSTNQLYIVAGSNSGSVHLLKASDGGVLALQTLIGGHTGLVRSVFWDPYSHTINTCGEEGRLCIWKPLSVLQLSSPSPLPQFSSSSSSSSDSAVQSPSRTNGAPNESVDRRVKTPKRTDEEEPQ